MLVIGAPVLSNNYAYISVRDRISEDMTIWRFDLDSTKQLGDAQIVAAGLARADNQGGPIVVGNALWYSSKNPTVQRISDAGFARGEEFWPQYKFDAAKTGNNTVGAAIIPGDSGGCFISTVLSN